MTHTLGSNKQKELFVDAASAAVRAGAYIMELFDNDDYEVTMKSDNSPVTLADKVAHDEIERYLSKTRIPIMSEEGRNIAYDERKTWDIYWLVDPLDGTRQFLKKKKEFTVNIALIINNYPVFGVVYAPAYGKLYMGHILLGSCRIDNIKPNKNANFKGDTILDEAIKLPSALANNDDVFTIFTSPNHTTHSTLEFIDQMRKQHTKVDVVPMASSLKICMLADGDADVYVRHADTYEWDTAAAQAILEGAGGYIKSLDNQQRLTYNKESLINSWFICQKAIL